MKEEPQFWDARKLKPIGIGIAALLAISLSYAGVKALTKPSVKPPTIIAQPAAAAPQQIATTSETAAPQIATATETAAPELTLTNPPSVPEPAQNEALLNQTPETAALTLTNPATAPSATQDVAPPNQDVTGNAGAAQNVAPPNQAATGNAAAAQKQGAAAQSTSRTQPSQPQIAAKPSDASTRSALRRFGLRAGAILQTRSSDASTRSASSGQTAAESSGAEHSTAAALADAPPPAAPVDRAPAAGSQESYRAADQAISHLGKANIAFNTPQSMAYGETRTIELVLHPSMSGPQLGRAINAEGPQEYAPIRASAQMEAYLTGDGFDITPSSRTARQIVSNREVTKWSWDVHAKRLKLQRLHLSLQAVIEMNGKETSKTDVFDRDILVRITGFHSAALVVEDNWQLTAAVSTAFLGIIGWLIKKLLAKRATATA